MSYRTASGPLNERRLLHHAKVGRFLDELRCLHGGLGADITIQLKNGNILRIHSPVAAAHSPYFRQLVVDKGPALHLDVSNSPRPDAVKRVVDYMYSGTIDADLSDFVDVLHVAHIWEVRSLSELLETRLLEYSRQPSTMLKALDVTALNTTVSAATRSVVLDNALKNFRQIVQSRSGFAKLSPNSVIALLSNDELPVNSELDVARIVLSYLHITGNRGLDEQLLCVIRIEHLDAAGLAELEHLVRSQDPTLTALLHRIVQSIKADAFRSQRPRRRFTASGAAPSTGVPNQRGRGHSNSRLSTQQQPSQTRLGAVGVAPFGTTISQVRLQPQSTFQSASSAQPVHRPTFGTPPFVDERSQAFVNRQLRTENSVAEIRKVPDPFARKTSDDVFPPAPFVDERSQAFVNRQLRTENSVAELRKVPDQFARKASDDVFAPAPLANDRSQAFVNRQLRTENSVADIRKVPDPFARKTSDDVFAPAPLVNDRSQAFVNRQLRTENSVAELRKVPDQFARKANDNVFAPRPQLSQATPVSQPRDRFEYSPYLEDSTQAVVNRNLRSKSSIFELRNVPDVFGQSDRRSKYPDPFGSDRLASQNSYQSAQPLGYQTALGNRQDYSPYVEQGSQTAINRNMRTKDSVFEIRNAPDLFDDKSGFGLTNQYNQQSLRNASTQTQADFVELPDPFGPPKQATTLDVARAINAAGHRTSLNHHIPNQMPLQVHQGSSFVPAGQTLTFPNSSTSNAYKKLDGPQLYHDADSIVEITRVPDPFGNGVVNARVLPQMDSSITGSQQRPSYVTGHI